MQKSTINASLDKLQMNWKTTSNKENDKDNYYNCLNNKQSILSENQVLNERISTLTGYIERYERKRKISLIN